MTPTRRAKLWPASSRACRSLRQTSRKSARVGLQSAASCSDRAISLPCSLPPAAPTTSPAARAIASARWKWVPLLPHAVPAPPRRCRERFDERRPRTTFPWLFPPPSSHHQCSAKHLCIDRALHGLAPSVVNIGASTMSTPLNAARRSRPRSSGPHLWHCRSVQITDLDS
jgi:hypothetical protein